MKKYINPRPKPTPKPGNDSGKEPRYKIQPVKPAPKPKPKTPRKGINPPPSKIKNQKSGLKRSRANDTIMSRIKPDGSRALTTQKKKSEGYR